jgi:hypothetical protein
MCTKEPPAICTESTWAPIVDRISSKECLLVACHTDHESWWSFRCATSADGLFYDLLFFATSLPSTFHLFILAGTLKWIIRTHGRNKHHVGRMFDGQ